MVKSLDGNTNLFDIRARILQGNTLAPFFLCDHSGLCPQNSTWQSKQLQFHTQEKKGDGTSGSKNCCGPCWWLSFALWHNVKLHPIISLSRISFTLCWTTSFIYKSTQTLIEELFNIFEYYIHSYILFEVSNIYAYICMGGREVMCVQAVKAFTPCRH